jgi:hypothetical protein
MKISSLESFSSESNMPEKKERAVRLRESISKKIGYISKIRTEIDSPEITGMSMEEFSGWTESEKENIFIEFPEQKTIIERVAFLIAEIKKLNIEIREINARKEIITHAAVERYIKDDSDKLEKYWNDELDAQDEADLEDDSLTPEEKEEVSLLDEQEDTLSTECYEYMDERDVLLRNEDTLFVFTAHSFFQKISEKKAEVSYVRDLFEKGSLDGFSKYNHKITNFMKEKGVNNIDIKFDTYDIVVYLSKEDVKKFFATEEGNQGWHYKGTPLSFVITEGITEEKAAYVETHEKGHNKSECLQDAGIHNTIYYEQVVRFLTSETQRYQALKSMQVPEVVLENTLDIIVGKIRSQIRYLNGEISADVENLIKGNFDGFYFHFLNTAEGLYNIIRRSTSIREDKELVSLLRKEIDDLTKKAAEHVKNALFLSMVARKYHKEDEFFAAMLMSPQNVRLAERYLKDELGGDFEFEKSFTTFVPEYVLPENIHHRVYRVHEDSSVGFMKSIFSDNASRGIIPPKNYVSSKKKSGETGTHKRFSIFEHKFTELFEVSGIFNPTELKRFVTFATDERISQLSEDEKEQAAYTLEEGVSDNMFVNKVFDKFLDIHKPVEIRDYAQNIKKVFDIFGKQEEGKLFIREIFETCFYKAFKSSVPQDNPETLMNFMKSWDGIEFELEKYISDEGNSYGEEWDIEDILEDSKTEDELKDRIINDTQSTKVFQYIKSLGK